MAEVIICDDEDSVRVVLATLMERNGHQPLLARSVAELNGYIMAQRGQILLCDIHLHDGNGLELLPKIRQLRPDLGVIIISARADLVTNISAQDKGAFEFVAKPFDINHISALVQKLCEKSLGSVPFINLKKEYKDIDQFIGQSPAMQEVFRIIARSAQNTLAVMIQGESGTGKELVARAIHQYSARRDQPFVAINMAAIPRELIESELFGHERGAFTGAVNAQIGKFAMANQGTIFLDEIGDMPMHAQTRLLRVLQNGEFTKVGGHKTETTNARIICATHRNLPQLIKNGEFRSDLYYRLLVIPITIPPLRQRRDDIERFCQFFIQKAIGQGLQPIILEKPALEFIKNCAFAGNVRQLENYILRLCALYPGQRITNDIAGREYGADDHDTNHNNDGDLAKIIEDYCTQGGIDDKDLWDNITQQVELGFHRYFYQKTHKNQLKTAQLSGINRNTIAKKWQKYFS